MSGQTFTTNIIQWQGHDMAKMDSIIFYRSFYEALQCITDTAERGFMYDSIMAYAFDGIEPSDLTPLQNMAFTLIKPQLDANVKKSEAGKRGGRPKKETTENEKPQVSEKKTIGFENENHRFSESESNKNKNVNKNSEYEYVSSNENKNSNLPHDIPTTTDIISELKTTYYMTDSEAADVSNAFIDFNSGRNWSSLETRSWQSLLKQFVGKDKRFTDDVLSERKVKAERESEEERLRAEEEAKHWQGDTCFPTGQDFVEYLKGHKYTTYDEEIATDLYWMSEYVETEYGYDHDDNAFTEAELIQMFESGIITVDMQVGIVELFHEPDIAICQNDALVAKIRKQQASYKPSFKPPKPESFEPKGSFDDLQ